MKIAIVAAIALGLFGADPAPSPSVDRTIVVDNLPRTYRVHHPVSAGDGAALVVMLHGYGGSAERAESAYGWDAEADRDGFVVAFPDGIGAAWNAGSCCGSPMRHDIDDVKFLRSVVAEIERSEGVDPHRIFFTGMSNGAFMTYRMACDATLPMAGIASVAGTAVVDCAHPQKLAVLEIHGLADDRVPFGGDANHDFPPVTDTVGIFATADGCTSSASQTHATVTDRRWTCPSPGDVRLITIAGAGHRWPIAAPASSEFDATSTIAGFFKLSGPTSR